MHGLRLSPPAPNTNQSATCANDMLRLVRTETSPFDRRPVDVAYEEWRYSLGLALPHDENPRITLYLASAGGKACPSGTPWCAAFVNFCVRQSGRKGTDSMMARSWHESSWGTEVAPEEADEGDVVVFAKPGQFYGHVAFYVEGDADGATCIGGNQRQRVGKRRYEFHNPSLKLLSIRRPPSSCDA